MSEPERSSPSAPGGIHSSRFNDMTEHMIDQRTPEWFALRRGKITASEVGMFILLAKNDKKSLDARQNLIDKKLGEMADGEDTAPSYEDYWMKRGTLLEPESMDAYERETGEKIFHVGFAEHDTLPIGCSPDARHLGKITGCEGKVVAGKTQIARLRDNVLPAEYVCQIHHSMIVYGAPFWDFWSYHSKLPPFYIRTFRDAFTDQLEDGLFSICAELRQQEVAIARKFREWQEAAYSKPELIES